MRERAKWMACFGLLGSMVLVGAVSATSARRVEASPRGQDAAQRAAQATPAAGQKVYNGVCGRCHPGGREDIGPAILNKNLPEPRMAKIIREGTGRMKAIPARRLPDTNMPALMAYLRSIHAVR